MNKSDSIVKIAGALLKAQSEMGNAVKDSKNPFFKSNFATLNAVREACLPVLNKHGVSVFQPTTVIDSKVYVETLMLHESGEYISGLYEVVTGKQNDPQATGAAVSYARRYALQAMVNIGAEDDDGESAMGRHTKASPAKTEAKVETKAETADVAPAKKTGFGVKAAATVATVTKTETTDDSWS